MSVLFYWRYINSFLDVPTVVTVSIKFVKLSDINPAGVSLLKIKQILHSSYFQTDFIEGNWYCYKILVKHFASRIKVDFHVTKSTNITIKYNKKLQTMYLNNFSFKESLYFMKKFFGMNNAKALYKLMTSCDLIGQGAKKSTW